MTSRCRGACWSKRAARAIWETWTVPQAKPGSQLLLACASRACQGIKRASGAHGQPLDHHVYSHSGKNQNRGWGSSGPSAVSVGDLYPGSVPPCAPSSMLVHLAEQPGASISRTCDANALAPFPDPRAPRTPSAMPRATGQLPRPPSRESGIRLSRVAGDLPGNYIQQ